MMQVLGYVPRDSRNNGIRNAMCMAMLLQRDAQLDHITVTTLQQIAATCPDSLREASATLSRILAASGTIEEGGDYRITQRRRPPREYNATADVPTKWLVWCKRWRATSVLRPSSILSGWYVLLKYGQLVS